MTERPGTAPAGGDEALAALARRAGIAVDWTDAAGVPRRVGAATLRVLLGALGLPAGTDSDIAESRRRLDTDKALPAMVTMQQGKRIVLPRGIVEGATDGELVHEDGTVRAVTLAPRAGGTTAGTVGPRVTETGYHRLRVGAHETVLAVAPQRCLTLDERAAGRRLWGVAAQVYALSRPGDGGIGDAGGVAALARAAASHGADAVALSPVHSLFAADPSRYGPYSPSSRLFLNPLLADPALVLGEARIAALRFGTEREATAPPAGGLVDWPRAAAAKFALLRRLFDDFVHHDLAGATDLARDFERFVAAGGRDLAAHARFEAHHASALAAEPPRGDWRTWGNPLPEPEARAVQHHLFLQWLADRSFAAAQQAATGAGMRIGLITDLAIGMDRTGSHAWSRRDDLLQGLSIGAPPDAFNPLGQDWGLAGFSPRALAASGFAPFLATLRAAMRHAGGVRIDHVMGLARLWLVPDGAVPSEGAYLACPAGDLMRLLALESRRHDAVVIGEDLGTVPPGFRTRLRRGGIAGMDVMWFERTRTTFRSPARWRDDAVAMTTTHDLPTVAGWWRGADIETRGTLGLARPDEAVQRRLDRRRLWRAFRAAGASDGEPPVADAPARAVDAALAFVASSPAPLMLAPLEDLLGIAEQPNLPGTIDQHPNWQRRFSLDAAELLQAPDATRRAALIGRSRKAASGRK